MIFLLGFISGAVTVSLVLYCLYTGQWYRFSLYFFFDAAGLTTTSDDLVQLGGKKAVSKNRPKIRRMRLENDRLTFLLYPASGKKLADYIDKTEEMAQALHMASATIEPVGIGDHGCVIAYFKDPIPSKFSMKDLIAYEQ
ncbi:hypothetical protein [Bifidobacterium moukalabense]|uniref:hypothetical protein n=1 Tax=Bifidobacterium moukalabense TaxID=1333651 RepID=UPI0010F8778C|nr:hypothetical protein [Bifidobacterium moukalabense]